MLSIRMQRLGRKGYPTYRIVVQDKRQAPNSGKVIEYLGNYNPHTKEVNLKKDLIEKFLKNGAHPSESVARLFKKEGIKLPKWVNLAKSDVKKSIKNPEKLRKNQPKEESKPEAPADTSEEKTEGEEATDNTSPEPAEEKTEDVSSEEPESQEEPSETEEAKE